MQSLTAAVVVLLLATRAAAQPEPQLGSIRFPTSGSPAAQEHFLRGVAWLHSFGYLDAMEEFERAQQIDPDFALAYWGEAMANNQSIWYTQDLQAARRALARLGPTPATRAATAKTPRERAYLAAVEVLFGSGEKPARDLAYAAAMERLVAQCPDDDEAQVFYALALLATQGRAEIISPTRLKAGAIAEAVFKRNPNHPGATHIVIHSYDDGEHAKQALDAARAYARVAPASSHALHMPAHIFLQLGLWDEAAASDEASFAASDAWVKRKGLSLASRDYHSLSWLQYEYLQQGRYRKAKEAMAPLEEALKEKLGATTGEGQHSHFNSEESSEGRGVRLLATMRARYVIETRRFQEMKGQPSFDSLDEMFAVGMSAVVLSDFARAQETLTLLGRQVAMGNGVGRLIDAVMEKEMAAMIQLARSQTAEGVRLLTEAASIEDHIPGPVGLPFPVKRARELLGEVLLGLGRPEEAGEQFQLALARTANRPASVIGLARAQARLGNHAASRDNYARFLKMWHLADPELPELQEARNALDGQSSGGAAGGTRPTPAPAKRLDGESTFRSVWLAGAAAATVLALIAAFAVVRRSAQAPVSAAGRRGRDRQKGPRPRAR